MCERSRVRVLVQEQRAGLGRRALFVLAAFCLFAGVATVRAAHAGGNATVSPDGGTLFTQFSFSVTDLAPGHGVEITLYDGEGKRFTYQKDGIDQAMVVDASGAASLSVVPGRDLPGAVAGTWKVVFVEEETGNTVTIPFQVTSPAG